MAKLTKEQKKEVREFLGDVAELVKEKSEKFSVLWNEKEGMGIFEIEDGQTTTLSAEVDSYDNEVSYYAYCQWGLVESCEDGNPESFYLGNNKRALKIMRAYIKQGKAIGDHDKSAEGCDIDD